MALKDILSKPKVTKKVDPSTGDVVNQALDPSLVASDTLIDDTPVRQVVYDLEPVYTEVQSEILSAIATIESVNSGSKVFREYAEVVKAQYFDPMTLLTNRNARPAQVEYVRLRSLEREVYRTSDDPRAPFYWDLHRALEDLGINRYALERIWKDIVESNRLYSELEPGRMLSFALFKERQQARSLQIYSRSILSTIPSALGSCFANTVADGLVNGVIGTLNDLERVELALRGFDNLASVLSLGLLDSGSAWESIVSTIDKSRGPIMDAISNHIASTQLFAVTNGLFPQLHSVFNALDIGSGDCDEFDLMRNQAERFIGEQINRVQQHFLNRERIGIEISKLRTGLLVNASGAAKNKAYTKSLNAIRGTLSGVRGTIRNQGTLNEIVRESVRNNLMNQLENLHYDF